MLHARLPNCVALILPLDRARLAPLGQVFAFVCPTTISGREIAAAFGVIALRDRLRLPLLAPAERKAQAVSRIPLQLTRGKAHAEKDFSFIVNIKSILHSKDKILQNAGYQRRIGLSIDAPLNNSAA
jgi:hypothetical protein